MLSKESSLSLRRIQELLAEGVARGEVEMLINDNGQPVYRLTDVGEANLARLTGKLQ
jgi:hypothetical protein